MKNEDDEEPCEACGEVGNDFCTCIDCGAELCTGCAVGQRCDDCDCGYLEDSE